MVYFSWLFLASRLVVTEYEAYIYIVFSLNGHLLTLLNDVKTNFNGGVGPSGGTWRFSMEVCSNFVILGLRTLYVLLAWATKIINRHSKAETISKLNGPFTIGAKLSFTCKNVYFMNDEVRAGFSNLGHTTLVIFILSIFSEPPPPPFFFNFF